MLLLAAWSFLFLPVPENFSTFSHPKGFDSPPGICYNLVTIEYYVYFGNFLI